MYDPELGRERAVSVALEDLNWRYKHLKFVEYDVNGADDVVNWEKMMWAGKKHEFRKMIIKDGKEALGRLITIPRNEGDNNSLKSLLKRVGFDSQMNTALWGLRSKTFQAPK